MMQDSITPENKPSQPGRKGRLQLVLLFLIPSLAMGTAWFLYFFASDWVTGGQTNKGELVIPPASFESMRLKDESGVFALEQLEGKWGILVFAEGSCSSEPCQETMYQTRQAHIALGKESDRVVRVFITSNQIAVETEFKKEHPGIIWLDSDKESVIKALKAQKWPENQYFIVDPLGNIMMKYQSGQYGRDVLKDLQKLLKASNIG